VVRSGFFIYCNIYFLLRPEVHGYHGYEKGENIFSIKLGEKTMKLLNFSVASPINIDAVIQKSKIHKNLKKYFKGSCLIMIIE